MTRRLSRRYFAPLASASKVQGRLGEWQRLGLRLSGYADERGLSDQANDWLMRTMRRECRRREVTAVHAYEDCSLWQFEEAKRRGKICLYDMPVGYYPAWEDSQSRLIQKYSDWLPPTTLALCPARSQQKRKELDLADLTLVPSSFVEGTIRAFAPYKQTALAPYGVDLDFWQATPRQEGQGPLRFIYAGNLSLRKGTPFLIEAWKKAELPDAELELVGSWQLADHQRRSLPESVRHTAACSREVLRERFQASDVFVFPSFFEGFGLVLLEAMACGLPAIASQSSAAPDVLTSACGMVIPAGRVDALVESLRSFNQNWQHLPAMRHAARLRAEQFTWESYRDCVKNAVAPFV